MKKSSMLITALFICLAILAVCAWTLFGRNLGLSYANADQYTAGEARIASPVENLDVHWTEGQINVEYHTGTEILVSETASRALSGDDQLRWWLDGTTLRIQYAKAGFRFSFNLNKTLTISLPEGTAFKTAGIYATSASMNIAELAADEIRLESTSGDLYAVTRTGKLSAGSTSGSLSLRQDSPLETADFSSTSGSISASLESVKELSAGSTSGDIALTVSGSAAKVYLHSTSGSIRADITRADQAEFTSTSGSIQTRLEAVSSLKIGSTSGSVNAALPTEPGFSCEISTTSGSFDSALALEKNGKVYTCGDGSGQVQISTTSGNIRLEQSR